MKKSVLLSMILALLLAAVLPALAQDEEMAEGEPVVYDGRYTFTLPAGWELNEGLTLDLVQANMDGMQVVVAGPTSYGTVIGGQTFESDAAALEFYLDRTGYGVSDAAAAENALASANITLDRRGLSGMAYLVDLGFTRRAVVLGLGDDVQAALDSVLESIDFPADLVDIAGEREDLSTFVAAVQAAGLETTVRESEVTVFAPTNDAIAAALETLGLTQDELLANTEVLSNLLSYHVNEGMVMVESELTMSNGEVVTLTTTLNDGAATVVESNIESYNGVLHVIDAVLVPASVIEALEATPEAEATEGE